MQSSSNRPYSTRVAAPQSHLPDHEEPHGFLLKLSDALRPLADPVEIQKSAMQLLAERLDVMRGTYFEVHSDQDSFTLTTRYERDPAPIPFEMRLSDFSPDLAGAYRLGRTLCVRDTEIEAPLESHRAAYRAIGIRAWAGVPLVKDGQLLALVCVHSRMPRDWTTADLHLLEDVAQRTWAAVERARAQAALRESEDRCRTQNAELLAVLESMSDGVYIGNRDGITLANQAALDQLGYATREELNRSIASLSEEINNRHPETGLRIADQDLPFLRALDGEQVVKEVLVRHRQSGEDRVMRSAASPIRIDGKLVGAVAVNTDITKEKQAQHALLETEKLAAVGRLATSIAHEINNPLEAVTNLIFLAEGSMISAEAKVYLQQAQNELTRIAHITAETLRFQRQNKEAAVADLGSVLDSVITLHEARLRSNRITLRRRYSPHRSLVCFPNELRQVAVNLVGNAIDAMKGSSRKILSLRIQPAHDPVTNQDGVRLVTADTGQGMNAATQQRIFEPFFTTKEHTGTGLGLWVARTIVDKHKGKIHVRSRTGEDSGTVFSIFLPNQLSKH